MKQYSLLLIILFSCFWSYGQSDFLNNVLYPKNPNTCKSCKSTWSSIPKEVQLSFYVTEKKEIFFTCSDERVLPKIFPSKFFTLSGELFSNKSFSCGAKAMNSEKLNGFVLRPMTLLQMKTKKVDSPKGTFSCSFGKLPSRFPNPKNVEINLLALKNNALCYYQTNMNVSSDRWDLLDVGMFMEDILFKDDFNKKNNNKVLFDYKFSRLSFEIPFEQNDAEIAGKKLEELYDSLGLADYDISSASIRAYSSVEGDLGTNLKLQNKRAKVISDFFKTRQPKIEVEVNANENWVEFYNDIVKNDEFKYFGNLKKEAIKLRLRDETFAKSLEPILKSHRKVIVILNVQPIFGKWEDEMNQGLIDFETSMASKNIKKAQEIQLALFEKIRRNEVPKSFLDKFEIPNTVDYAGLKRNLLVFKYFTGSSDILGAIQGFEELNKLGNDDKIKYNLNVLKLFLWQINLGKYAEYKEVLSSIKQLSSSTIDKSLVNRLMINYYILEAELQSFKKEYALKDQSVNKIYSNYKGVKDHEQLTKLARYFASYSQYSRAEYVLQDQLMNLSVSKDLLFYYLELTLHKDYLKKNKSYKSYINHGLLLDQNRYCEFFQSKDNGGVSFQLLKNEALKNIYCDKCSVIN